MTGSLPLVNLSLLRPLVAGMKVRGLDPEPVLSQVGLTEAAIEDDAASVHVMVVHQFLETCASATGDRHFCGRIAMDLDPTGWPMIRAALEIATSLAQFLAIYVSRSGEVASSVGTYLNVRGDLAVFGETRLFRPTILPAQNDAFMSALAVTMLRQVLDAPLDPAQMMLVVSEPAAVPAELGSFQVLRGDEMGFRLQFPSAWLGRPIGWQDATSRTEVAPPVSADRSFVEDFRRLLKQEIAKGGLSALEAAALVSMRRDALARRLARQGTTISAEVQSARIAFAKRALRGAEMSVEDIAAALGYSDPSNFSRAFKQSEGISPSRFRATSSMGGEG